MKFLGILFLFAALGLSGCNGQRMSEHEKRITDLESKLTALEAKQKQDADAIAQKQKQDAALVDEQRVDAAVIAQQRYDFSKCVHTANAEFQQSVDRNKGIFGMNPRTFDSLQIQKQGRLEECHRLYK